MGQPPGQVSSGPVVQEQGKGGEECDGVGVGNGAQVLRPRRVQLRKTPPYPNLYLSYMGLLGTSKFAGADLRSPTEQAETRFGVKNQTFSYPRRTPTCSVSVLDMARAVQPC